LYIPPDLPVAAKTTMMGFDMSEVCRCRTYWLSLRGGARRLLYMQRSQTSGRNDVAETIELIYGLIESGGRRRLVSQ
jgi:hypothetical protein